VAIICGVFSIVPGIGVAMALVMLPALTHTAILVRGEAKSGHLLGAGEKIMLFVGSLMLVAMAGVAAAIAFGVTCFVSFWPASAVGDALGTGQYPGLAWGFTVGIGLGGIVAAYVAYRLLVMLSRSKGRDALSRRSKMILAAAIVLTIVGAMILAGMGL